MSVSIQVHLNGKPAPESQFPKLTISHGRYYWLRVWIMGAKYVTNDGKTLEGESLMEESSPSGDENDAFEYSECVAILSYLKAIVFPEAAIHYKNIYEKFVAVFQAVVDYGNKDDISVVYN